MPHIELDDFVTRAAAGVSYLDADIHRSVFGDLPGTHPQIRELERRIAEAESERVKRLALEVHVGAAVADVVVHDRRQLIEGFWAGFDEVAARRGGAEEDLRQRSQIGRA